MKTFATPLPKILYRGDDDRKDVRNLRATSHLNQFHTNLINGGDGSKIFNEPLIELIDKHIVSEFSKSHFLSFTEDKIAAFRYGLHLSEANEQTVELCCHQYLESDKQWDFSILTIKTDKLIVDNNPFPGIYECLYRPTLYQFAQFSYYRIFLIDAFTALKNVEPMASNSALEYSEYDKEWLVLPATLKALNFGQVQYSSILDGGCFGSTEYYKIDQEKHKYCNTISY